MNLASLNEGEWPRENRSMVWWITRHVNKCNTALFTVPFSFKWFKPQ